MKKSIAWAITAALLAAQPALARKQPDLTYPVAPTLPIEARLVQQEIRVNVPDNGAAAGYAVGGLLGALIGSAINKSAANHAEKRVVDLRNALIDYDFNARMTEELRGMDFTAFSPQPELRLLDSSFAADYEAGKVQAEPYVLVVTPDYAVNNDFESMTVSLGVSLTTRETKRNGKIKVVAQPYFRNYTWQFVLPPGVGGKDENAGRIAALGKERLQWMLDKGIDEVVAMAQHDLTDEGRAEVAEAAKARNEWLQLGGIRLKGQQVRGSETGSELVVRQFNGNMVQGIVLVDTEAPLPVTEATEAVATEAAPAVDTATVTTETAPLESAPAAETATPADAEAPAATDAPAPTAAGGATP